MSAYRQQGIRPDYPAENPAAPPRKPKRYMRRFVRWPGAPAVVAASILSAFGGGLMMFGSEQGTRVLGAVLVGTVVFVGAVVALVHWHFWASDLPKDKP